MAETYETQGEVSLAQTYHEKGKLTFHQSLACYDKANELTNSSELLRGKADLCKALGKEQDAVLLEHKTHAQELKEGKVPS